MSRVVLCILVAVSSIGAFVLRSNLPAYIERCSRTDPNLNECVIRTGNRAIPYLAHGDARYNIPSMVPYKLKDVVVRNDNQLRFILRNVRVYGLDKARLTEVDMDFPQSTLAQNLTIPRLNLLGDYELSGTILDESVHGKGRANITIVNGVYTSRMKFRTVNNRAVPAGYTYYKPAVVIYELENLYDGNEFRGYQTNIFFNNNWKEVNKVFERGTANYLNDLIIQVHKSIASIVPVDELFLP